MRIPFLLTFLLIFNAHSAISKGKKAPALPYDTVSNRIIFDTIVSIPGKTKDILHSAANEWVATNYRSAKDVIQLNDKAAGILIAKGIYGSIIWGLGEISVRHTLTVKVKDDKIRIIITDLFESTYDRPMEEMYHPKHGMVWFNANQRDRVELQLNNRMRKTVSGLIEMVSGATKSDDW